MYSVGLLHRMSRLFGLRSLGNRFLRKDDQFFGRTFLRIEVDLPDRNVGTGQPIGRSHRRLEAVRFREDVGVVVAVALEQPVEIRVGVGAI